MKAIQTHALNCKFRSRTEARWGVFFETLGLKWEYEPEGFDLGDGVWYLPDFRVLYPNRGEPVWEWFEVKSDLSLITPAEWQKLVLFSRNHRITVLDGKPAETVYLPADAILRGGIEYDDPIVGFVPSRKALAACQDPGRQGAVLWSHKGRLWNDYAAEVFQEDSTIDDECVALIRKAIRAANSADFKHGAVA